MTSENGLKTNEFLRRRKLRLQQVREQSKDIAKKVRQRAKVENLRQVVELDSKKQKEYLLRQERLVKQLEEYYAKGLKNVGASHRNASEVLLQDDESNKVDLSKQRGKEATAELRKKRQEILDGQKKLLDRKLQARETANEISRDKSATIATKFQSKIANKEIEDSQSKCSVDDSDKNGNKKRNEEKNVDVAKNDMATQWDLEEMPNEWETNIPTLLLPKDDNSVKESSDKSKRLDLFALSEEMPSSLRGGLTNQAERVPVKSSLTLVSEYLQNRDLRLRETDTTHSKQKVEDLKSLKQTILRTRASKEGIMSISVCHVHDEELIPVPSWQAVHQCNVCPRGALHNHYEKSSEFLNTGELHQKHSSFLGARSARVDLPNKTFSSRPARRDMLNGIFSSIRSAHPDLLPSPVLRGTSPFRRDKVCPRSSKGNTNRPFQSSTESSTVPKKSSVTMYNHATRDSRDIPYTDERLVVRDLHDDYDAYSQAMKESTTKQNLEKNHHKKVQEVRSKVAMSKQNVEKEYKDTISFLNALPKGNKPIKTAFMDEQRQEMQKESRQQKLRQEYKKIEKECNKLSCRNKQPKSISPTRKIDDDFESTDFQYSWMPFPESDGNLAIHTIPTSLKEGKSGNTVKFSKVDSYHEYRTRHKHTPPTKDTAQEKSKRHVEAVVIQNSSDTESVSSESSTENIRLEKNKTVENTEKLSDAERIIIYKILDSKVNKRKKKTSKLMKNIAKSLTLIEKQNVNNEDSDNQSKKKDDKNSNSNAENFVTYEQLNEGVYKAVNENGDNISSMYFRDGEGGSMTQQEKNNGCTCNCKKLRRDCQRRICKCSGTVSQLQWEDGSQTPNPRSYKSCPEECDCGCKKPPEQENNKTHVHSSAATSTTSFKTAGNGKAPVPDGGFIKFIDDAGQEAGKFYIGASGFLKDDAYEVVIQLRKKGDERDNSTENLDDNNTKQKKEEPLCFDKVVGSATQTILEERPEITRSKTEAVASASTVTDFPPEVKKIGLQEDTAVSVVSEVLGNSNLNQITPSEHDSPRSCSAVNSKLNISEKGNSMACQDNDAQNVPKSNPTPRPATSTYTQTSMSSPNHRPVFFHMSSSTSTAYMSPPEMILPKFMRHDYQLTDEELYDSRKYEMEEIEHTEKHEYSEEPDCRCRRCPHAKKVMLSRHFHAPSQRHRKASHQNTSTPPNTARSGGPTENVKEIYFNAENKNKKKKCTCRKCQSHNSLPDDDNSLSQNKSDEFAATKRPSRNLVMQVSSSITSLNKCQSTSKRSKTNLKPVIKSYVDKLLILNQESLKAVHVVDQDCSSVTTPGSSIIDVPNNINNHKPTLEKKLSLQQIRDMLQQKIINNSEKKEHKTCSVDISNQNSETCLAKKCTRHIKHSKHGRKKTAHKIKSLNISKHLLRGKKTCDVKQSSRNKPVSSSSSTNKECVNKKMSPILSRCKVRSKSSPTPRLAPNSDTTDKSVNSDLTHAKLNKREIRSKFSGYNPQPIRFNERKGQARHISESSIPGTLASTSPDSDRNLSSLKRSNVEIPMSISTQTSINVDGDTNFMKLAEDKLQNMEKIADLTEKCTKRLSNLAKVLEEVRKNKTLAYSHISTSDTASDSDQKSDKNVTKISTPQEPINDTINTNKTSESQPPVLGKMDTLIESHNVLNTSNYIPLLSNIPKPVAFKSLDSDLDINSSSSSSTKSNPPSPAQENLDYPNKNKGKPPPALSRIHLKHVQDYVVPHELSTVVEVDSPMSVKLKSSRNDKFDTPESSDRNNIIKKEESINLQVEIKMRDSNKDPDLLDSKVELSRAMTDDQPKMSATESSINSKAQMIDLRQFNEIMLKPFFSLQEYAKQCNIGALDDGSNLDDIVKDDQINDELSSLHSEVSLPDVISELLKRNVISEPFKFDTGSNANSTTVSSESTMSVLALSKVKQGKKKSSVMFQNKENIGETSDTLSISSNPDLENAFKKLGLGWASSTLKKTKERLALSSSSNTSSSSLSKFRVRTFNKDIPVLVTDTVTSALDVSKKELQNNADSLKNAQQQTSLTNSMTVKEFLTNELAKKITFNKRNDTEEEFVTLFETIMPEDMKHSSLMVHEENSIDNSVRSGNNNRARTSTPVQLFKSMTYHSSSSSNMSNGLFSNADDLSSVKVTSNSMKHSTSDKDDLIIPNFSLRMKRGSSEYSKSD